MQSMLHAIKFFAHYFKRYWPLVFSLWFLVIVVTVFQVQAPIYMGKAIQGMADYLGGNATMAPVYTAITIFISCGVIVALSQLVAGVIESIVGSKIVNDMRQDFFHKLQRLQVRYFDQHKDGEILSRFTSDLDNIYNAMNEAIFQMFFQIALIIGVIIAMFRQSVPMAWVTLALIPVTALVAGVVIKRAEKHVSQQQAKVGVLNGYMNEQINGAPVVISNGLRQASIEGFESLNRDVRKTTLTGQAWSGILYPLMLGMGLVNTAIVIAAGSYFAANGLADSATMLGLIVMFVAFSQQLYQPISQITSTYNMLQLAITGTQRLAEVMDEAEEPALDEGIPFTGLRHDVTLEDVHFSYQPGREILHGIDIEVDKGQMVALVGPTGSGKTTVMNLMNRFYDVTEGAVKFDGVDVRDYTLASLREHVGIVLQESLIFTGTVRDNIAYGKPDATEAEVEAAAKQANIHDFIMTLPNGYATEVSAENSPFSTGQKQLLSIARTILMNPDLLILDEATSNVDTVTEAKIQKAMDHVIAGRTSFVIAHRLKTILNADKIVVLKDGNIIETGTHDELLAQDGFYAELYRNQMAFEG